MLFLPDWLEAEDAEMQSPIRCLRAAFHTEYTLTHRDFLGSLMGLGIVREKTGDILVKALSELGLRQEAKKMEEQISALK